MDQKGKKFARKKPLAGCVACMAIYRPTPDLKGRTFKLCILIRWDLNFCVLTHSNQDTMYFKAGLSSSLH